jgi:hypothetical protein
MQHPDKHNYNICPENTDETLETKAYNVRVQPLQHIQYLNLLLQHPHETIATYL